MNRWENVTFGKSGKYFKFCYVAMLLYVAIILSVAGIILYPREYDVMSVKAVMINIMIIVMTLYCLWLSVPSWAALEFLNTSIQSISKNESAEIYIRLFKGTVYKISGSVKISEDFSSICTPSVNYLYLQDKENSVQLILSCEYGDFYTVADNDGYEKIKNILVQSKNPTPMD